MPTVPRISTVVRAWLPLIVPPVNTTVLPAVVNVPPTAVNVQLWPVRRVPARVRLPLGLLMASGGRSPTRVV